MSSKMCTHENEKTLICTFLQCQENAFTCAKCLIANHNHEYFMELDEFETRFQPYQQPFNKRNEIEKKAQKVFEALRNTWIRDLEEKKAQFMSRLNQVADSELAEKIAEIKDGNLENRSLVVSIMNSETLVQPQAMQHLEQLQKDLDRIGKQLRPKKRGPVKHARAPESEAELDAICPIKKSPKPAEPVVVLRPLSIPETQIQSRCLRYTDPATPNYLQITENTVLQCKQFSDLIIDYSQITKIELTIGYTDEPPVQVTSRGQRAMEKDFSIFLSWLNELKQIRSLNLKIGKNFPLDNKKLELIETALNSLENLLEINLTFRPLSGNRRSVNSMRKIEVTTRFW